MPPSAPTDPSRPLTVYFHRGCPDGAAAAWVAMRASHKPVRLVPIRPGELTGLPDAMGSDVLMVDVCVDGPQLDELSRVAGSVTVLDHHKTSQPWTVGRPWVHVAADACGAMLAWRHFHGEAPPPAVVRYVQDMDLWRNELPHTRTVQHLLRKMTAPNQVGEVASALENDFHATIQRLQAHADKDAAVVARYVEQAAAARLGEATVQHVSLRPGDAGLASDVANELAIRRGGVGVAWRRDGKKWRYSLRSVPGQGPDVAALAQQHGGGGHTHAAGFQALRQVLTLER